MHQDAAMTSAPVEFMRRANERLAQLGSTARDACVRDARALQSTTVWLCSRMNWAT